MSKCPKCGSDVKPHVVCGNSDRVRKREGVSEAMKRITDKMRLDWAACNLVHVKMTLDGKFILDTVDNSDPKEDERVGFRQAIDSAIRSSRKAKP